MTTCTFPTLDGVVEIDIGLLEQELNSANIVVQMSEYVLLGAGVIITPVNVSVR